MKLKTNSHIKKYGPLVNLLVILVLLGFIWIQVHWAMAVMFAWMAYSMSMFASGMSDIKKDYDTKIKAVRQDIKDMIQQAAQKTVVKVVGEVKQGIDLLKPQPPKVNPDRPSCMQCMVDPAPGSIIYNQGNCPIHN